MKEPSRQLADHPPQACSSATASRREVWGLDRHPSADCPSLKSALALAASGKKGFLLQEHRKIASKWATTIACDAGKFSRAPHPLSISSWIGL
jgi:hypothetical protein